MSIFAGTLKTLFAMFINNQIHLENRLKLLRDNLYQGPKTYNTAEGLKTYYESVLIEMNQINEAMKASIDLIEKNVALFPDQPLFETNFQGLKKEFTLLSEILKDDLNANSNLKKAFAEFLKLLQKAHVSLNNPDDDKKLRFYDILRNEFEAEHWPNMKRQFHADCIADLPRRIENRKKQLEYYRDDIRKSLDKNPVVVYKKKALLGDIMDEISKDGQLIPESIAPTIFKYRHDIKDEEYVFEFFRLFNIYQIVCTELDAISLKQSSVETSNLESWFNMLGNKLQPAVKSDYRKRFPQLLHDLCHQSELKVAFTKCTLKDKYNLKLAYNLFGLMKRKDIFTDMSFIALDGMVSKTRQDQYIKAGYYDNDLKNGNVLNPELRQTACDIIDTWLRKN